MRADGTNQVNRTKYPTGNGLNPAWSPDGTQIVFTRNEGDCEFCDFEIYKMRADGTGQTRLTDNVANDYSPDWQPTP